MVANPGNVVTPRQLELLALYASGYSLAQIGQMKFLSYHTVQEALSEAKLRVGAKSLTHLCVMLVDHGLIMKNGQGYKPVQEDRVIG